MDRRKLRFDTFTETDRITVRLRHEDRERLHRAREEHRTTTSGLLREAAKLLLTALDESNGRPPITFGHANFRTAGRNTLS